MRQDLLARQSPVPVGRPAVVESDGIDARAKDVRDGPAALEPRAAIEGFRTQPILAARSELGDEPPAVELFEMGGHRRPRQRPVDPQGQNLPSRRRPRACGGAPRHLPRRHLPNLRSSEPEGRSRRQPRGRGTPDMEPHRDPNDLLTVADVQARYGFSTAHAARKVMHEAGAFRPSQGRTGLLVRWSNLLAWERARERPREAPSAVAPPGLPPAPPAGPRGLTAGRSPPGFRPVRSRRISGRADDAEEDDARPPLQGASRD